MGRTSRRRVSGFRTTVVSITVLVMLGGVGSLASGAITGEDNVRLGEALASADFDQDGFDDLVAGGTGAANGAATEAGLAAVFRGRVDFEQASLTLADADVKILGSAQGGHSGKALGTVLWDPDAVPDLAVGEPDNGAGKVYIVPGSLIASRMKPAGSGVITLTETGVGITAVNGESQGDRFGAAINSRPFDADMDGRSDLLVGSPARSGTRTVFYDDFSDGEWSMGPAWSSHSGHMRIEGASCCR